MERKNQLTNRLPMSLLLLLVVLTFSKCKKGADAAPIQSPDQTAIQAVSGSTTSGSLKTLNATRAVKDEGLSYKIYDDLGTTSDSPTQPTVSSVRIFENGKEIGPGHSVHADIRTIGKGRFSHWLGGLYFTTSDNSDPRTNGRTYTYTIDGSTGTAPTTDKPSQIPGTPQLKIIGYANVDGSTTGGLNGKTVTVSTLSDLKKSAESDSPLIIKVSGVITGSGFVSIKSNKSILGMKGSRIEGVGLLVYGTSNVIIQNMTIKNVVTYSNIVIKEGAHHVWVDHCDLSSDRTRGWDYYDGLLDVGNRADYVSLSWNKLHDSHIPMLIGFGDANTNDTGHLRTTVYNNYFYNCSERQPSTRFGYIHCFNNYLLNGSGYGIGVTMGATVRTDNNYFENQKVPIFTDYNARPGYVSGAATNYYKGSGANKISTSASTWVPAYEYKSALIAVANVPSTIVNGAGAILTL
jgi:pectate lyase